MFKIIFNFNREYEEALAELHDVELHAKMRGWELWGAILAVILEQARNEKGKITWISFFRVMAKALAALAFVVFRSGSDQVVSNGAREWKDLVELPNLTERSEDRDK